MGSKSSENDLIKVIKNLWMPFAGCIGAITLVVQFVELWKGDQGTVTWVLTGFALFFIFFALINVGFSKEKVDNKLAIPAGYKLNQHRYPKHFKLARFGLFTISLLALFSGYLLFLRLKELEDKVIVLITNIEGLDTQKYRFTEELITELQVAFQDNDKVMIIPLNLTISEQQGKKIARKKGTEWHADLVIWGWYAITDTDVLVTAHVENMNGSKYQSLQESDLDQAQSTSQDAQTFVSQKHLAEKMKFLVQVVIGLIYLEAGDSESALKLLSDRALENELLISKAEILYYRANAYVDLNQFNEAINDLNVSILSNPDNPDAYTSRGNIYYKVGQYDAAVSDYKMAMEFTPFNPIAHYNLGKAYIATENYDEAIVSFNKAIELKPDSPTFFTGLGLSYAYINEYENAISNFDKAIDLDSKNPTVYFWRGNTYALLKQYEQAVLDYNQALQLDPQNATIYINRGITYSLINENELASADYKKAIDINPSDANAYYNLGVLNFNLDEFDQSIESFSSAIQLNPQMAEAYINRGSTYATTGEFEQAINDFQKALEFSNLDTETVERTNQHLSQAYNDLGHSLSNQGQYEQANYNFNKSISYNPQLTIAFYNRSIARVMLNQPEDAITDMQKYYQLLEGTEAITKEEASVYLSNSLYGFGYTSSIKNQYDVAIKFFDKAIDLNPNFAEAYCSKGVIYAKLGLYDQAIENLNNAIQINPQMGIAYYSRGIIYATLEQNQMAITDFEKALEIYKDSDIKIKEDIEYRLEKLNKGN